MKEKKALPYVSDRGFFSVAKKSKKIRNRPYIEIVFKKLFNYPLYIIAYWAPLNSIRVFCNRLRGVNIGKNVFIGMHCTIDFAYPDYVYLNDNASLTGKNYVLAHNRPHEHFKGRLESFVAPVIIGNHSLIGVGATLLPGTKVGDGAVVSAGSVVFNDVPAQVLVRGNPAEKVIDFNKKISAVDLVMKPDEQLVYQTNSSHLRVKTESRLLELAACTFGNTPSLDLDTDKDSIPGWDSLGNMNLLLAVEEEFGFEFTEEEMVSIQSIRDILTILENNRV